MSAIRFGLLLLATLAACNPFAEAPPLVQTAEYQGADEDAALGQFVRQQVAPPRQAVLYFYADWCGPCRRFRETLRSQPVGDALRSATLVKLNADNYPELAGQLGITAIPAFLKIDSAGHVTAHITSDKWQEDTPANIAPVMRELVSGHSYDAR